MKGEFVQRDYELKGATLGDDDLCRSFVSSVEWAKRLGVIKIEDKNGDFARKHAFVINSGQEGVGLVATNWLSKTDRLSIESWRMKGRLSLLLRLVKDNLLYNGQIDMRVVSDLVALEGNRYLARFSLSSETLGKTLRMGIDANGKPFATSVHKGEVHVLMRDGVWQSGVNAELHYWGVSYELLPQADFMMFQNLFKRFWRDKMGKVMDYNEVVRWFNYELEREILEKYGKR